MNYSNSNNINTIGGLGAPSSGFSSRSRLNSKRLSVALPPKIGSISENQVDQPTPRTSRSHLLAGLRTQPKTPAAPASAPYNQTQHQVPGMSASKWANHTNYNHHEKGVPQTATGTSFEYSNHYSNNAGRQIYSLPEQVLAPPSLYEADDVDPAVLQQMQMTSLYLAQRQQQLQQQLANITAAAQGMSLDGNMQRNQHQQAQLQQMYGQQQMQSPMEVPGQPGVYLIFNPAIQGYQYVVDQEAQRQAAMSPTQHSHQQAYFNSHSSFESIAPSVSVSPPETERNTPVNTRSFTPLKKESPAPSTLEHVEPLPPPSATAFRRGHKKSASLAIDPNATAAEGPRTASTAVQGTQRSIMTPGPMTSTFGPGAARSGDHPIRQPRGPPPLEELVSAPTSKHEGSKNFSTRQRRRALDNLVRAGSSRRGVSRSSSNSSPIDNSSLSDEGEDLASVDSNPSRRMSPIGYEMQQKRGSRGSGDGYFGLSSASSSSEGEDTGAFKQPPTPATPGGQEGVDRKKMMLGVLNAAEKRRSFAF